MPGLYEDIDEDIDEADDEDIDEDVGESDDEGLAERRRRRRRRGPKVRGGRYAGGSRGDRLQQMSAKVGQDVRQLAASVKASEDRRIAADARQRAQLQNLSMMSALMPLLTRKTMTLKELEAKPDTKVVVGDTDMLGILLPMMMFSSMGQGSSSSNNGATIGGMDPMMGMMMVLAVSGGLGGNK